MFITGTDTEVGKTFFTALLIRSLRRAGIDAVGFKPLACGSWDDVDALVDAAEGIETRRSTCAFHFSAPVSPFAAAQMERVTIEPAQIVAAYDRLATRHEMVIVEGIGGWLVPITAGWSVADFARQLGLPVIVVVKNRLGAINHTMLTLESISRTGLECAGLVLNHLDGFSEFATLSNRGTLEKISSARILCELSPGQGTLDLRALGLPGVHL